MCVCAAETQKKQHTPELVAFADRGGDESFFRVSRRHCAAVAEQEMPVKGIYEGVERFIFRGSTSIGGHSWNGKRVDELELVSARPINRNTYHKYVVRFKYALQHVCKLSPKAIKEFGMHSLRVGDDTWLFKANFTGDVRQCMGDWASAFSEKMYIRTQINKRLEVCKAMGV